MFELDPQNPIFRTFKVVREFDGMLVSALCQPPGLLIYGKETITKAALDFANNGQHPLSFDDFDAAADFLLQFSFYELQIWLAYGRGRIEKLPDVKKFLKAEGIPLTIEWPMGTIMYEEIALSMLIYKTIPSLKMSDLNSWDRLSEARQPGIYRWRQMVEDLQVIRKNWRESDERQGL